jgi:GNAT superfamily N-acetyltransferase
VDQLAEISLISFPDEKRPIEVRRENIGGWMRSSLMTNDAITLHVVRREGEIVSSATVVPKVIGTSAGLLKVAGLCGVMTHPDARGQGLGKEVVLSAFQRVDSGEFPFAVFQTGAARGFYERLNCCVIEARIVNSLNEADPQASPLWDPFPMRYPCGGDWPEGELDFAGGAW